MKYNIYKKFASVYDKIYQNQFYYNYARFIKKIIKKYRLKHIHILDLACGTGRLIKELSREGFRNIEGLDSSKEMIKIAKSRNKEIKFYNQSLINFNIKKRYNLIICTFDSINYVTNKKKLMKVFSNIAKHLYHGGIFVFDFNTVYKKVREKKEINNVIYNSVLKKNYWDLKITMREKDRIYEEYHRERLYRLEELKPIIVKNKFKIVEVYSSFNKKVYEPNKYQRLIVVVKKSEV